MSTSLRSAIKIWRIRPHDPATCEKIARENQISDLLAQLLINRGVVEPHHVRRFLDGPFTGLHDPKLMPGAEAAADRIVAAIRGKKRVCIFGDYDVDGTTGTAILLQTLIALGGAAEFYVPHRLEEGYGLNSEALQKLHASNCELVVSVDCGISALNECDEAKRLGLDLIVTDHHEINDRLPDATVLVHPRLPGGGYPFGDISGAGVALKLAWLVAQKAEGEAKVSTRLREILLDAVALAALGLVADVVPLHDENRILVKHGLNRLHAKPSPGLKALIASAGLGEAASVRAEDVAFKLAPRLNAAGRLGCARLVVDLLTTPSEQRARDLAQFLEGQNQERQRTERKIQAEAKEMAAALGADQWPAIVLASESWHPGVIGIVAGRLAEHFGRPTLLIAVGADVATGSGRSIPGFALHEALAACHGDLLSHGGHAAAAGFRLKPENIEAFREKFLTTVGDRMPDGPPPPRLDIDLEAPLSSLTPKIVRELDRLEPYGAGNPRPRFLASGLEIVGEPKLMGQGERHMSFRVRQGRTNLRAVAWGMAERREELVSANNRCSVVFSPKINEWNGYSNVELEVADFQAGERAKLG